MKIAIITGASSGYGKEFVRQMDARNYDEFWLIARRAERLQEMKLEIQTPIRVLGLDLTDPESIRYITGLLKTEKPEVKALVNASGFGHFGDFASSSIDEAMNMIDLNDKALVGLCYACIPYMSSGDEIYNIASSSAFQPVPYIGVYAATKAFVLSFSRSLNQELCTRGIKVLAVCPHWTKTEFFDRAIQDKTVIQYYNFYNDMKAVVTAALVNMAKGKDVSLVGFRLKLQVFMVKHFSTGFVMKTWLKQQKKPYLK